MRLNNDETMSRGEAMMDLAEITDELIDNLILRMPTDDRKMAIEAVLLSLAWLIRRGLLIYKERP